MIRDFKHMSNCISAGGSMMPAKSLGFKAKLIWDGESGAEVKANESKDLKLDVPAEFGGRGRYPCPDELFLAGSAGCLLTTFLYFRGKLNFYMEHFEILTSGTLGAESDGYRTAGIEVTMLVTTNRSEKTKAKRCIELTKKHCHITRTLKEANPIRISGRIECSLLQT
jgi:organic hydroperoxide reductase OsmC/OhrA